MAALHRAFASRVPNRRDVMLASLVAGAYFVLGVAFYDPAYATGTADWGSVSSTVWTIGWIAAMLVGGWALGAWGGAGFGVLLSVLTIPAGIVATGQAPAMSAGVWAITIMASVVFGAMAGALADHYRLARQRNAELARKNAELEATTQALARSEAMFREFADRVEIGMWIAPTKPDASAFANAATRRMFGVTSEEAEQWREHVHPDDRQALDASVAALQQGVPQDLEYRLKLPGQEVRWVRGQSFALLDDSGKPATYAGLLEDITARKDREAQRELIERRERLSALGTLVAGVAHEINNPLTYVMGNMELARVEHARLAQTHAIGPEELERYDRLMSTSLEGSQRIARIVQALRAVTRGRQGDATEEVNLNAIATNVHALVRTGVPKHISLELALSPTDPIVRGSSGELHQILLNLATNAIQAMGPKRGRIVIETRVEGQDATLAVRDEGPGVPPEVRARLFTPFFTTKAEGTGLGLSIAHSIAQEYGGDIDVESRPGEGALFRVRLPRASMPAAREVVA